MTLSMAGLWIYLISIVLLCSTTYACKPTTQCGYSSVSASLLIQRIIGGDVAENRAWGWMISLQIDETHACGASLITAEYAITAAHCFDELPLLSRYSILAGTNQLNDSKSRTIQRRALQEIHTHPNFNDDTFAHDIAIIRFSPLSMDLDANLTFICLPQYAQDPYQVGDNLVAIGWGVTSFSSNIASNDLRQVSVRVYDTVSEQCKSILFANATLQFCAGIENGSKGMH
jgi:secreted trypsin-like serine protease